MATKQQEKIKRQKQRIIDKSKQAKNHRNKDPKEEDTQFKPISEQECFQYNPATQCHNTEELNELMKLLKAKKNLQKLQNGTQKSKQDSLEANVSQKDNTCSTAEKDSRHLQAKQNSSKNIFRNIFMPKPNLNQQRINLDLKIQKERQTKDAKQIQKQRKYQQWKLKQDMKKMEMLMEFQPDLELNPKNQFPVIKNTKLFPDRTVKKTFKVSENSEDAAIDSKPEEKKQQHKEKSQSKKKIKKVKNYQRLDLRRKFKEHYTGGIKEHQRKYHKNGTLKFKYRTDNAELQMDQGELHDSYMSSLSKAFLVDLNLDSQDQEGQQTTESQLRIKSIPSISEFSKQSMKNFLKTVFAFEQFRQGQLQIIQNVIHKKSSIFVSETASGKSLTYIMSSLILAKQSNGMSIVISPLIALMLDQLQHLPTQLPAACISSLIDYQQRKKILALVKSNKVKLLFMTPETLSSDILFHLKQFPPINFVCIDEAHCLSELSHNFRTSYLALSQIILNQINYENNKTNILCLTATANTQTVQSLSKKLNIRPQNILISSCTINKNLYITATRQIGIDAKLKSLVEYINLREIKKCSGILVYCRAKYIIDKVFYFLQNSGITARIFHGTLPNKQKTDLITMFKQRQIKVVISTTALGMGLDFQHLDCIIHFTMPKSIETFVQQIGRAGRRSNRAYCQLFLDENDFLMERNYILADQLEAQSLKTIISELKKSKYTAHKSFAQQQIKAKSKNQKNKNKKSIALKKPDQNILSQEIDVDENNVQNEEQNSEKQENNKSQCENSQMERVIKRATLQMERINEEAFDISSEGKYKYSQKQSTLHFIRAKELSEKTYLRQQALLMILMRIAVLVNESFPDQKEALIKILPLSNEILKLSFFKANEKNLKQSQDWGKFFCDLVDWPTGAQKPLGRKLSGTYHISLISKCNQLQLSPIQLLTKVYAMTNQYTMKVEFVTEAYVLSINTSNVTFNEIISLLLKQNVQKELIKRVNQVQTTSMSKLNVFYSLAFNYSQIGVSELTNKGLVISRSQPLPQDNIMKEITKYFKNDLQKYHLQLTQGEKDIYLPTQDIHTQQHDSVLGHIKLFFKHLFSNIRDIENKGEAVLKKHKIYESYYDGKIITRVFLGVNQEKTSRRIYGEHSYWRKFIKKKYAPLLTLVRQLIQRNKEEILNL